MKKRYLTIVLLFVFFYSQAQIVRIPDANFLDALLNHTPTVDTNFDGVIQVTEAEAVTILYFGSNYIQSLTGIQFFINIEELTCRSNQLTTIDLSENKNLRILNVGYNNLEVLDITQNLFLETLACNSNNISTLNISENILLELLYYSSNNIQTIDTSLNIELKQINCNFNQVSNLDVSNNINLISIWCSDNLIEDLDLTNNINLQILDCSENSLEYLDISQNPLLIQLECSDNNISSLSVVNNPFIFWMDINNNQLTEIDLSQNTELEFLYCNDNFIESIDLSQNDQIKKFRCDNNQLSYLNIKNGNNDILSFMTSTDNIDLFCIQTDNQDPNNPWCDVLNEYGWCKDTWADYSKDCGYLGTDDLELFSEFIIYPNPVQDLLTIEKNSTSQITSIKIYDAIGRLVLDEEGNTKQLDISSLNSGLLFIKIETDEGVLTKKIIKE